MHVNKYMCISDLCSLFDHDSRLRASCATASQVTCIGLALCYTQRPLGKDRR